MCLIVDANVAALFFQRPSPLDYTLAVKWLFEGKGILVYGGRNATELGKVTRAMDAIIELKRAGRAVEIDAKEVGAQELKVQESCKSDDPHVIALARVSGARLLCSEDGNLHIDFKNLKLVPSPKGKIYQNAMHAGLLKHTSGCQA